MRGATLIFIALWLTGAELRADDHDGQVGGRPKAYGRVRRAGRGVSTGSEPAGPSNFSLSVLELRARLANRPLGNLESLKTQLEKFKEADKDELPSAAESLAKKIQPALPKDGKEIDFKKLMRELGLEEDKHDEQIAALTKAVKALPELEDAAPRRKGKATRDEGKPAPLKNPSKGGDGESDDGVLPTAKKDGKVGEENPKADPDNKNPDPGAGNDPPQGGAQQNNNNNPPFANNAVLPPALNNQQNRSNDPQNPEGGDDDGGGSQDGGQQQQPGSPGGSPGEARKASPPNREIPEFSKLNPIPFQMPEPPEEEDLSRLTVLAGTPGAAYDPTSIVDAIVKETNDRFNQDKIFELYGNLFPSRLLRKPQLPLSGPLPGQSRLPLGDRVRLRNRIPAR